MKNAKENNFWRKKTTKILHYFSLVVLSVFLLNINIHKKMFSLQNWSCRGQILCIVKEVLICNYHTFWWTLCILKHKKISAVHLKLPHVILSAFFASILTILKLTLNDTVFRLREIVWKSRYLRKISMQVQIRLKFFSLSRHVF